MAWHIIWIYYSLVFYQDMRTQTSWSGKGGKSPRLFTAPELHMKIVAMPFKHLFVAVYNSSDLFSMGSLWLWFGNLCSISKEVQVRDLLVCTVSQVCCKRRIHTKKMEGEREKCCDKCLAVIAAAGKKMKVRFLFILTVQAYPSKFSNH